jgi:hypothetical protein
VGNQTPFVPTARRSVVDAAGAGGVLTPRAVLTAYAWTMPSTVASLLSAIGLEPSGRVTWGTPVPEISTGVYLVALSAAAHTVEGTHRDAPISSAAVDKLRAICPALTLDGKRHPSQVELTRRIGSYWLPDETVLYVGLAGQPLRTRVRQYYRTPLGAAKPHKGGWWLKTLSVLADLHVHFAATAEFKDAEESILRAFAANVSDDSRSRLATGEPVMPFANLRDGDWRRRNHGIAGATTGAMAKSTPTATSMPVRGAPSRPRRAASAGRRPHRTFARRT